MFYGRMKEYKIESPVFEEDAYRHKRITYKDQGTAFIYITEQDRTLNTDLNELAIIKATLVGYTSNRQIRENWRIDEQYIVKSVLKAPHGQVVLYLEKIENAIVEV